MAFVLISFNVMCEWQVRFIKEARSVLVWMALLPVKTAQWPRIESAFLAFQKQGWCQTAPCWTEKEGTLGTLQRTTTHPPTSYRNVVSLPVQETIAKSSLDRITRHLPWSHLFISSSSGRGHSTAEVTHQREMWTCFCIFLWKAYPSLQCLLLGKGTARVLWEIKAR